MKQEIEFIKFNPTQNMTILVKTNHPVKDYKHIASKIMSYDSVYAEQVGFIEKATKDGAVASLYMAGGEFCGNACMSLAAFIASKKDLNNHDLIEIPLDVSGTDKLIKCDVKKSSDEYYCQVAMPLPEEIEEQIIQYDGDDLDVVTVKYQAFTHVVIEVEQFNEIEREKAQTLAKSLGSTLGAKMIGILLYQSKTSELAPLIYIPHVDTMIWERGCGSGTASLGAYLAWKSKEEIVAQIKQPGGIIHVIANYEQEAITSVKIKGSVRIVAQGKAFIDV